MALSETVVLRVEEALAKLEKLDARLTALFGRQHILKVSTSQASKQVAQLSKTIQAAVEKPRSVQLSVAAASKSVASLQAQISALNTKIKIDANTAPAVAKIASLRTSLRQLSGTGGVGLARLSEGIGSLGKAAGTIKPGNVENLAKLTRSINKLEIPAEKVRDITRLAKMLSAAFEPLAQSSQSIEATSKALGRLSKAVGGFQVNSVGLSNIAKTVRFVEAISESVSTAGKNISGLSKSITNLGRAVSNFTFDPTNLQNLTSAVASFEATGEKLDTVAANMTRASRASKGAASSIQNAVDAAEDLNIALNETSISLPTLATQLSRFGRGMTLYVTFPIVAAIGAASALAAQFNDTIARTRLLTSAIELTQAQFDDIVKGIKDIAAETGRTPNEVARGFYFLASAVDAADARLSTLRVAAQGAAIGLGEVEKLTDTLSSVINAYGRENITAAQAGDILVESIRAAKVEASDFAPQLGRLLPLASELGLSFDQVGAALALLTRTGNSAAVASTQLRSLLLALVKPPEKAASNLAKVGLTFTDIRDALRSGGLEAAIRLLTSRFGQNEEALTGLFRRQEAYLALLQIAQGNFAAFNSILAETKTGFDNVSGSLTLFGDFQKLSPTLRLRQEFSELINTAIRLGTSALPVVTEALVALNAAVKQLASLFRQPLIGGILKVGLGFAALVGPLLLASSAIARFEVITRVLPSIAQNLASRLLVLRTGASNVTEALQAAGITVEQFNNRMQRVERAVTAATKAINAVAAVAFGAFTASLAGAAAAASDGTVKLASLATAIGSIGISAGVAGIQIASIAGPIAGIGAAAATAGIGLFSMFSALESARKRRLDKVLNDTFKPLAGLDAEEILIRFNFVADENQTKQAAQRALNDFKAFISELVKDDKLTELEADIIVNVLASGNLKDFDQLIKDVAKNGRKALDKYIKDFDADARKQLLPVIEKSLNQIKLLGEDVARVTADGVLSAADSYELLSKTIRQLPDDIQEYASALLEAGAITAKFNAATGNVEFSISNLAKAQQALADDARLSIRPALEQVFDGLEKSGVLAAVAAEKTTILSNSYGELVETADEDFELIPAEALDTVEDMVEAIEDVVDAYRELLGLTSEQAFISALNDTIVAAQDLQDTVKDTKLGRPIFEALLDATDINAEEIRDEIDSIVEDFLDATADAITAAAESGNAAELRAVEQAALERFSVLAPALAESLGVTVQQAFDLLAARGLTTEGISQFVRNLDVSDLADEIGAKGAEVAAALQAATRAGKAVGISIPLSPTFNIKDFSAQFDEISAQIAVLAKTSPPFLLTFVAELAKAGDEGTAALQELFAQQAITRDLLVNTLIRAEAQGGLDQRTITTLLGSPETREVVIEYAARLSAAETGRSVEETKREIQSKLSAGEPVTVPISFQIKPKFRNLSADTLERLAGTLPRDLLFGASRDLVIKKSAVELDLKVSADQAERQVDDLQAYIKDKDYTIKPTADMSAVRQALENVIQAIRNSNPILNIRTNLQRPRFAGLQALERGGVVEPQRFDNGGIARVPMVAKTRRGRGILWAEPETHGEAYIPFNPRHRDRAINVLGYVAEKFGFSLAPRVTAAGGLVVDLPQMTPRVEGVAALASAVNALAGSIAKLADSVQSDNTTNQDVPLVGSVSITSTIQDPRAAAMHFASELSRIMR